jgi:hypothetical protein
MSESNSYYVLFKFPDVSLSVCKSFASVDSYRQQLEKGLLVDGELKGCTPEVEGIDPIEGDRAVRADGFIYAMKGFGDALRANNEVMDRMRGSRG